MSNIKAITLLVNKDGILTCFFENKFAKYESSIKDDLGNEVWTAIYQDESLYNTHIELLKSNLKELKQFEDIE